MVRELIVAVASAAIALIVFVVGDRLRPKSWHGVDEDPAGALLLDMIKTFFTAVIAFIFVVCWQQYDDARKNTVVEANALVETYWAAHSMPGPDGQRIQDLVRDYTTGVLEVEWPVMDHDRQLSGQVQRTLDSLRQAVGQIDSPDPNIGNLRSSAMSSLEQVSKARSERGVTASHGIPGFLYTLLYIATVLLLFTPVLSAVRVTGRSTLMIGLLGMVVGSALLLIHELDYPFSGGDIVSRDAFEFARSRFQ
ncbi:DUF4239 domain-containing protein [Nocardia panacis]|uniref:DUF4239 domain-containing protein n=1 Tax=Nocardia panacis TaxID=2340916 RepID=A0A3A4KGU8_9NOCA|nr:DUF4239 domain-containing protein [Nocardia panacis]RJO72070.1 DUF4239 domain-containing protein [Nocardia panacis]